MNRISRLKKSNQKAMRCLAFALSATMLITGVPNIAGGDTPARVFAETISADNYAKKVSLPGNIKEPDLTKKPTGTETYYLNMFPTASSANLKNKTAMDVSRQAVTYLWNGDVERYEFGNSNFGFFRVCLLADAFWSNILYAAIRSDTNNYLTPEPSREKKYGFEDIWGRGTYVTNNNNGLVGYFKSNDKEYDTYETDGAYYAASGAGAWNEHWDDFADTGLRTVHSLAAVQDDIYALPTYILEKQYKKKGVSSGDLKSCTKLPAALSDTTHQLVNYRMISTVEDTKNGNYEYDVMGEVFYDYQFIPIADDSAIAYSDELQKMMADANASVASCDGFSFNSATDSNAVYTTIDNPLPEKKTVTVGQEFSYSGSAENEFETSTETENTIGYDISASIGAGIEAGPEWLKTKLDMEADFSKAYENSIGRGDSSSTTNGTEWEKTTTTEVESEVPAYSTVTVYSDAATRDVTVSYDNACYVSYKVLIFSINGEFALNGSSISAKNYTQKSYATIFGNVDENEKTTGSRKDALEAVHDRYTAYFKGDTTNEDTVYSKVYTWNGSAFDNGKQVRVDWSVFKERSKDDHPDTMYSDREELEWNWHYNTHAMTYVGATMTASEKSVTYHYSEPLVSEPLKQIKLLKTKISTKSLSQVTLLPNKKFLFSDYPLKAYFADGTDYSTFDQSKGKWVLCDEDGNEVESSDVIKLGTDGGGNLHVKGIAQGTGYVKYVINEGGLEEGGYSYYDAATKTSYPISNADITSAFIEFDVYGKASDGDIDYATGDDGTAIVTGTKKKNIKSVNIPNKITVNGKTYKVKEISEKAFKNCKKLKKVTLGANVEKIGANAFHGAKNLSHIKIKSKKLKKAFVKAFLAKSYVKTLDIPESMRAAYRKFLTKKILKARYKITLK